MQRVPLVDPMQDPLLEALIHEAMASGPDLHIAAARVKEADLRWQATSAGFGPSLDFSDRLTRRSVEPIFQLWR